MFEVRTRIKKWAAKRRNAAALPAELKQRMSLKELRSHALSRTQTYLYCDYFFNNFLPDHIREHRRYFSQAGRGFGEDAFHSMWFLIFEERRPARALEIGVFRGQTITLWKLLSQHFDFQCDIGCISPFSSAGDSVSQYGTRINYYDDVVANHQAFNLPLPRISKEFSTAPHAATFIHSQQWDIAYIDGNHDYAVAREDWVNCSRSLAPKGIVVLDDSALTTDFEPPEFSTAGHPGPSRVASEIDTAVFDEIIGVGHNRAFQRKS